MNIQARGSRSQLRVTHKLLAKPFFYTFATESEATDYGTRLEALLARGIVPAEMLATRASPRKPDDPLMIEIVRAYMKEAPEITRSDEELLGQMLEELASIRFDEITFQWLDQYLIMLKTVRHIKPSTVRKRIGALGRVADWHLRRTTPKGEKPPANPFRLLPRGYSLYSQDDTKRLKAAGLEPKQDEEHDRRLAPEEAAAVDAVLAGRKRDDRERPMPCDPEFVMLYYLLVDTGLRLSEGFRLRVDQVDVAKGLLKTDGSKGHRGALKPRTIPLKPKLRERLKAYCAGRVGLLLPFWDGSPKDFRKCSARLSSRFTTLFEYAGVKDFTAHDLRHEATCRWVTLRNSAGHWAFSDTELCKIMGWKSTNMMLRYASLRGEDLVARLA